MRTIVTSSTTVTLEADPRSAAQARRFVLDELARAGGEELGPAAELLVSELVANAVLHARSQVTVAVIAAPDTVRIEVSDGSAAGPRQRRFSNEASTGRGLLLVEAMSSAWGVIQRAGGKTIWFELVAEMA